MIVARIRGRRRGVDGEAADPLRGDVADAAERDEVRGVRLIRREIDDALARGREGAGAAKVPGAGARLRDPARLDEVRAGRTGDGEGEAVGEGRGGDVEGPRPVIAARRAP